MATPITIAYWAGFRGLGEKIKLVAELVKLPYTFKGYTSQEEWAPEKAALKTDLPNLPYYKEGDFILTESEAIIRHIVLKAGRQDLLGKNSHDIVEYAVLDGVSNDLQRDMFPLIRTEDPKFEENWGTKVLARGERIDKHIAGRKWAVGDDLTLVDLKLSELFEQIVAVKPDNAAKLPNLAELNKKVRAIPEIAAFKASDRTSKLFVPPFVQSHIKV